MIENNAQAINAAAAKAVLLETLFIEIVSLAQRILETLDDAEDACDCEPDSKTYKHIENSARLAALIGAYGDMGINEFDPSKRINGAPDLWLLSKGVQDALAYRGQLALSST